MIRLADRGDVSRILAIYRPYILNTCITFETEVPSERAFLERFETITAHYPWIVWEEKGKILGYAYGDRAFARAAYDWDADLSIYLSEDARGMGLGGKLYGCLEALLARQGYHNLYALVTGENERSCRFHERHGYERIGVQRDSGWKHGRWHDVIWYAKRLCPAEDPGPSPRAFVCGEEERKLMERFSCRESK